MAGIGGLVSTIGPWYRGLLQPPWKPDDAWFGPVWTVIFTLAATAATRAWMHAPDRHARRRLPPAFALNGALNVLWSWLFFQQRRPDLALLEIPLLWLSIALLMLLCARSDTLAAALLLPYLLWVTFAALLNLAVVRLNAPF